MDPLQFLPLCLSVSNMPGTPYFSLFGDSLGLAQSRQRQGKVATGIYYPLNWAARGERAGGGVAQKGR